MANALQRVLAPGEVVVLREEIMRPEYRALEHRLVRVTGGFGMKSFLRGTALAAQHLNDGVRTRYEGYDIDPELTRAWQKDYGMFGEQWTGVDNTNTTEGD